MLLFFSVFLVARLGTVMVSLAAGDWMAALATMLHVLLLLFFECVLFFK